MAWFQRLNSSEAGKSYALRDGDLVGVGAECALSLAPDEPSRFFARMRIEGRECWLEVLIPHSMRLNGAAGDLLELYDGAVVELCEREDRLRFSLQPPPEWGVPQQALPKLGGQPTNRPSKPPIPPPQTPPVALSPPEAPSPPGPMLRLESTASAPPPLDVPETTVTARTGGVHPPGTSASTPSIAFPPQPAPGWAAPYPSQVPLEPTPPLPLSEALPPLQSVWKADGRPSHRGDAIAPQAQKTPRQVTTVRETLVASPSNAPPAQTEWAQDLNQTSPPRIEGPSQKGKTAHDRHSLESGDERSLLRPALDIDASDVAGLAPGSVEPKLNTSVLAVGLLAVAGLVVLAFTWI